MSIENVTEQAVSELRQMTTGARENAYVLAGLRSPLRTLTANHEKALKRVGTGLFLGPWARALLYAVRYWPKVEHRALLQLVKAGRLLVVRVNNDASGQDFAEWLARTNPSESVHVNCDFAYVIVPSTYMDYLRAAGAVISASAAGGSE